MDWQVLGRTVRRWLGRATPYDAWQGQRRGVSYPAGSSLAVVGCRCGRCPEHGSLLADAILRRPQ